MVVVLFGLVHETGVVMGGFGWVTGRLERIVSPLSLLKGMLFRAAWKSTIYVATLLV